MQMINKIIFILLTLCCVANTHASTTISAQVVRNQVGSGATLISSGFPFPPGLVTESMITAGTIKVLVNGSEVAANVSSLRGRHRDGSLRSALIQFTQSMAQGDVVSAQVIVDGGVRASTDPTYVRPTLTIVQNNNVILPTDASYLSSTFITFQGLIPSTAGTTAEEKQYTTLADTAFDALVVSQSEGAANYEEVRGMVSLWARTGNIKYFNQAVAHIQTWLTYNTPPHTDPENGRLCKADAYINPDSRPTAYNCDQPSEPVFSRVLSYATLYLLTGYRDFWSIVAYNAQYQQYDITDQTTADSAIIPWSGYDTPRSDYTARYGALLAAYMIDATIPINGNWTGSRVYNWQNQFTWTLNAIKNNEWNFRWVPFNNGSGTVPAVGATITKGGVSAPLLGVYAQRFDPIVRAGNAMPSSGYLMVGSISGGSFSAGTLSGISATATGPDESDYRQGLVGTRANSPRQPNEPPSTDTIIPTFQLIFPVNFMIDYYLNVYADSRIPGMVKTNLDIILKQIHPLVEGDHNYGVNGGNWGNPVWGNGYPLTNPIDAGIASPWNLPEFTRIVAFVLKTTGNATVNGADYATWYSRLIDTANNYDLAGAQWKLFGQFYGFGADTPWMMAQTSLLGSQSMRIPTNYSAIPGDKPDVGRVASGGWIHKTGAASITRGGGATLMRVQ